MVAGLLSRHSISQSDAVGPLTSGMLWHLDWLRRQVPHQVRRPMPHPGHRSAAGPRGPTLGGPPLRAVLADVRELAALRHSTQERTAAAARRLLQGQGASPRDPRLRRPACPRVAEVVGQDCSRNTSTTSGNGCSPLSAFRQPTPEVARYAWESVKPADPDVAPLSHRLMRAIADRARWRQALEAARRAASEGPPSLSATGGHRAA
jgi:hypothetical protein